jgi:hypothetical protein
LLNHQSSLTQFEEQLAELDKADGENEENQLLPCSIEMDRSSTGNPLRVQLLQKIEKEMTEYDALLLREHSISAIKSASRRSHKSLFDWIYNEQPLVPNELAFIYHRDDFLALDMNEESWFLGFSHKFRMIIPDFLINVNTRSH